MSYYYKYDFISPESVYANVKEELKSYFDTGAVDDLMFSTWTDKCLRKLGKSSYSISETILFIQDFEARLPDNFSKIREAWLCTQVRGFSYQSASSFYSQASSQTTIQVSPVTTNGVSCESNCPPDRCTCMPKFIQAVYKTNNTMNQTFSRQYLLKPGNISSLDYCGGSCPNVNSNAADTFDIRDNKFSVNFQNGVVHLIFYAKEYDSNGYQLVPDNFRILEYIEAYIKYKVMEQLSNQVIDETSNQIERKLDRYSQLADEAYIMAEKEIKKQDIYAKVRAIKRQRHSFDKYQVADRNNKYNRYNWRRNP